MQESDQEPFEINMELSNYLKQNLSARMIQKLCDFCYKHKNLSQELFETIKANLASTPPIKRLNFFYLIDALVKHKIKNKYSGYFDLINSSLQEIVNLVLEVTKKDGKLIKGKVGLANLGGVRKVVDLWRGKYIDEESFKKIVNYLDSFDQKEVALSKEGIWKRMEDDRERQKRTREESWVVHGEDSEFTVAWQKARDLTNGDLEIMKTMQLKYDVSLESSSFK